MCSRDTASPAKGRNSGPGCPTPHSNVAINAHVSPSPTILTAPGFSTAQPFEDILTHPVRPWTTNTE